METRGEIIELTEDFAACRKMLSAIGDETKNYCYFDPETEHGKSSAEVKKGEKLGCIRQKNISPIELKFLSVGATMASNNTVKV